MVIHLSYFVEEPAHQQYRVREMNLNQPHPAYHISANFVLSCVLEHN